MPSIREVVSGLGAVGRGLAAANTSTPAATRLVTRRGALRLALAAGAGLVAQNLVPGIAWANGEGLSREGVRARFFIGSDVHMGPIYKPANAENKLRYALSLFKQIDPTYNMLALVGDLADMGLPSQFDTLMGIVDEAGMTSKTFFCQGNHDLVASLYIKSAADSLFKSKTGQDSYHASWVRAADGSIQATGSAAAGDVKVITMGPGAGAAGGIPGGWYADQTHYDFLQRQLADLKDDVPALLLVHHQLPNTTYTSEVMSYAGVYDDGSYRLTELMRKHPNLIVISGHSHATVEDERSIDQSLGFTCIQDATLGAYYDMESGKVDPSTGDAATVPQQMSNLFTDDANTTNYEACQGIILDVMDDNTARVYRVSFTRSKAADKSDGTPSTQGVGEVYIKQPWVIDVPGMAKGDEAAFPYRNRTSKAPTWGAGARVMLTGDSEERWHVRFPAAVPASDADNDMIHEYRISATPTAGGEAITHAVFNDYYRPTSVRKTEWDVVFKGLAANTKYEFSVVAATSFAGAGMEGEGISAPLTVTDSTGANPDAKPDVLLNVDFRRRSAKDWAQGHELDRSHYSGGTRMDKKLRQPVAMMDGKGGLRYTLPDRDYGYLKRDGFTAEVCFRVPSVEDDGQYRALFSSQNGSGFGFEIDGGNQLKFYYHTSGGIGAQGSVSPSFQIEAGTWYHALAVSDNETVTLFVNGQARESVQAGTLYEAATKVIYVGCDCDNFQNPQYPSRRNTAIAFARLYPRPFSTREVLEAFEKSGVQPTE